MESQGRFVSLLGAHIRDPHTPRFSVVGAEAEMQLRISDWAILHTIDDRRDSILAHNSDMSPIRTMSPIRVAVVGAGQRGLVSGFKRPCLTLDLCEIHSGASR